MLILKPTSFLSHAWTCGRAAVAAGTSERTRDTIIFQLLKQRSYLSLSLFIFACHISAQRQFFGAGRMCSLYRKELWENSAMPPTALLLADGLSSTHKKTEIGEHRVGFNLEEDVKVSINTILHDLRKIFRSGIYLACSQSPLLRITLN